eukprot:Gb_03433 [translate_table: standard]
MKRRALEDIPSFSNSLSSSSRFQKDNNPNSGSIFLKLPLAGFEGQRSPGVKLPSYSGLIFDLGICGCTCSSLPHTLTSDVSMDFKCETRPGSRDGPIPGMESVIATTSGYTGLEITKLIKLINQTGASYTGSLTKCNTHLVGSRSL